MFHLIRTHSFRLEIFFAFVSLTVFTIRYLQEKFCAELNNEAFFILKSCCDVFISSRRVKTVNGMKNFSLLTEWLH
jgi:hypothetical protein